MRNMSTSVPVTNPQPTLKNYVLAGKIGSGTYSNVYKAYRKVRTTFVVVQYPDTGSDTSDIFDQRRAHNLILVAQ